MGQKKYFVTEVETCAFCNGTGRVQHYLWEEFNEEFFKKKWKTTQERLDLEAEQEAWWNARDCYGWSIQSKREYNLPPEEVYCGECEGEGKFVSEVSLQYAISQIQLSDLPEE